MQSAPKTPKYYCLWPILFHLLLQSYVCGTQQPIQRNKGLGWDGVRYAEVSQHLQQGHWKGQAPFVSRVLVPLAAAKIRIYLSPGLSWPEVYGMLNSIAAFGLALLTWFWVSYWARSFGQTVLFWVLLQVHWLGPARFLWFYPMSVDVWAAFFFLSALLCYHLGKEKAKRYFYLSILCIALGVLVREYVLLATLTWLFDIRFRKKGLICLLLVLCVWLGCQFMPEKLGSYHTLGKMREWLMAKSAPSFILSYCQVFTLLPFWLIGNTWARGKIFAKKMSQKTSRSVLNNLLSSNKTGFLSIWVGICLLALMGGSDTERFFLWLQPLQIVLLLCFWQNDLLRKWYKVLIISILYSHQSHLLLPMTEPLVPAEAWFPVFWAYQKGAFLGLFAEHAHTYTRFWASCQYAALHIILALLWPLAKR